MTMRTSTLEATMNKFTDFTALVNAGIKWGQPPV